MPKKLSQFHLQTEAGLRLDNPHYAEGFGEARVASATQAGLTLIEVMVAFLVLSLGLTAATSIFVNSIASARLARNNLVASGLLQEGMEVMRNLRDSDWHALRPFGSFGNPGPVADSNYEVQWNSAQLRTLAGQVLREDPGSGLFSYDCCVNTIFRRQVNIATVSAVEKTVTVLVSWDQNGSPKSVAAEEHLFDWK